MFGKNLKYKCPVCGKKATVGSHFCVVNNENNDSAATEAKEVLIHGLKYIGSALLASLLIIALLWGSLGKYSLWALLITPGVLLAWLAWKLIRKLSTNEHYRKLLLLAGADQERAERLIQAEYLRDSARTRKECIESALERLMRDRSR